MNKDKQNNNNEGLLIKYLKSIVMYNVYIIIALGLFFNGTVLKLIDVLTEGLEDLFSPFPEIISDIVIIFVFISIVYEVLNKKRK